MYWSLKYVVIKTCGSVGVFLKYVSWSLLSNFGHIMHVYTLVDTKGEAMVE